MAATGHAFRFALSACSLAGVRLSPGRREILRELALSEYPRVVEPFVRDQSARLRTHPVTIYRFVASLVDARVLQQVTISGRRAVVLACQSANWLVCVRCGSVNSLVEPNVIPSWKDRLQRETGFRIDHHWYEASGLCPSCHLSP